MQALWSGLIGKVASVNQACDWNDEWIANPPFNRVHHILLCEFAIHWVDAVSTFMKGGSAKRVFATLG